MIDGFGRENALFWIDWILSQISSLPSPFSKASPSVHRTPFSWSKVMWDYNWEWAWSCFSIRNSARYSLRKHAPLSVPTQLFWAPYPFMHSCIVQLLFFSCPSSSRPTLDIHWLTDCSEFRALHSKPKSCISIPDLPDLPTGSTYLPDLPTWPPH